MWPACGVAAYTTAASVVGGRVRVFVRLDLLQTRFYCCRQLNTALNRLRCLVVGFGRRRQQAEGSLRGTGFESAGLAVWSGV